MVAAGEAELSPLPKDLPRGTGRRRNSGSVVGSFAIQLVFPTLARNGNAGPSCVPKIISEHLWLSEVTISGATLSPLPKDFP